MNPLDVMYLILGILAVAVLIYIKLDKKHLKDKQK